MNNILVERIFPLGIFLGLVLFCSTATADWANSANPMAHSFKPQDDLAVVQNPPTFSWSRAQGARGYDLMLTGPDNNEQVWQASRNWFLPTSRLKPGKYSWKVRPTASSDSWSNPHRFSVPTNATVFEVPDNKTLLEFIRTRNRPRSLPIGEKGASSWAATIRAQQTPLVQKLENQVRTYASKPFIEERSVMLVPRSQDEKAWASSLTNIRVNSLAESRQLRAAALLWRITGNTFYLKEAKRRGDALAALDPNGSTSHIQQDQGNRAIAWGLTVAYDYLSEDLSPESSAIWLDRIRARAGAIYTNFKSSGWSLEQQPLDAHGGTNLGYLAAISALMIDSIPASETWFLDTFRYYVTYESPWGGEDGGYANGTAYAQYATQYFADFWDPVAITTGVNMYTKPWSQGFLGFLACFIPPGAPSHVFGDGAETQPYTAPLKSYAKHYNDELAIWYSRNLVGEEDALITLTPGLSGINRTIEEKSCMFRDIGWVAMHSDLRNVDRTSIYFKSSPYGASSHSHGDQNSLTIVSGGQSLLIDSGGYDWWGSPLWKSWYRQTKAHNAITFDGGKGQLVDGNILELLKAGGRISAFSMTSTIDFAEGDAASAYGGALSKALRRIWFLKTSGVVIVWDKLESTIARVFEWNMHGSAPITPNHEGTIKILNKGQSLCITPLLRDGLRFDKRTDAPSRPGVFEDHGFFATQTAQKSAEFLFLLDIGCNAPSITLRTMSSGKEIRIGSETISIPD